MTNDKTTLTMSLSAKSVPLSEVAGSYNLVIGNANHVVQAESLKRGILTNIKNDLKGNFNHNFTSPSFNIGAGHPNQRRNLCSHDGQASYSSAFCGLC